MSTKSQSSQSLLQISAVVAAFAAVAQAVFGGILASHLAALGLVHATIGTVAILAAIGAVVGALRATADGATRALAIVAAILSVVQFGLGEMGGSLIMVHMVLGVAFLVVTVLLALRTYRTPASA